LIKRTIAVGLSAALIWLSAAPGVNAVAGEFAERGGAATAVVPVVPQGLPAGLPLMPASLPGTTLPGTALTQSGAGLPGTAIGATPAAVLPALPTAAVGLGAAARVQTPAAAAKSKDGAARKPIERTLQALAAPSLIEAAAPAGTDGSRGAASADFSTRIGLDAGASAASVEGTAVNGSVGQSGLTAHTHGTTTAKTKIATLVAAPADAERRSAYFPVASAIAAAFVTAGVYALSMLVPSFAATGQNVAPALGLAHVALSVLSWSAFAGTAAIAIAAVADAASFVYAIAKGKSVTNEQFAKFLRAEAAAGRLDAGLVGLVRPYRPEHRYRDLTFGFASGGFIYARPELMAVPWLLRLVLIHEHHHIQALKARGPPPRGFLRGLWARARAEAGARAAEFKGPSSAGDARVPILERALRQAQLSLNLDQPYDMLVLNPSTPELNDAKVYKGLSGDKARVQSVTTAAPQDVLAQNARKYRAVVLDQPAGQLPALATADRQRLDLALQQLDTLYVLATRRKRTEASGFKAGTDEARRYAELADKAEKLSHAPTPRTSAQLEQQIKALWRDVATTRLKGLTVTSLVENLYTGLENKGVAFLSFDAD
jgi:hypothetical protein